jgi:mannose-6-phosphate isomerase-like protein (cupin superfamily)
MQRRSLRRAVTASVITGGAIVITIGIAAENTRHGRNRLFVRTDAQSARVEPPPHDGRGSSTAYRYFDDITDAGVIFRKRALHKGASIGMHVLEHDEVYYIVSGRGEVSVDDSRREVEANTAIFMHAGADVGIRQLGDDDLVLIVSYPPVAKH